MRDFKGVLQSLVDAGHIRKLSRGYKASTRPGADDDPRHDLYKELLPLLDKDIDELYETDLHNFFLTIQDRIRNAKERLARVLKGN